MIRSNLISFVFFLLVNASLFSAGSVTHVFFAEKWLEKMPVLFSDEDKKEFIRGNLFPDIRYLGEISRDETHEKSLSLLDVLTSESPFLSGKRLHAFVDEHREAFITSRQLYKENFLASQSQAVTLLKIMEDEYFFDRIHAEETIESLFEISAKELDEASVESIHKWHALQMQYFSMRPREAIQLLAMLNLPFFNASKETVKAWNMNFDSLVSSSLFKDYVEELEKMFDELFLDPKKNK